jgi:membrane fusion protein (multidrug efflux system)
MKAMGTQTDKRKLPLELILADGRIYPHKGEIAFADRQVDVRTGTIRVAALFPNPGNLLRPGQFAKIRAMMETKKGALLIPQRSVTEMQGKYLVAVISSDNKVSIRPVKATEKVGSDWIIEEGLTPQDRIVAEGIQKVKEGLTINPKPFIAEAEKKQETPSKTEAKPAAPAQAEKR